MMLDDEAKHSFCAGCRSAVPIMRLGAFALLLALLSETETSERRDGPSDRPQANFALSRSRNVRSPALLSKHDRRLLAFVPFLHRQQPVDQHRDLQELGNSSFNPLLRRCETSRRGKKKVSQYCTLCNLFPLVRVLSECPHACAAISKIEQIDLHGFWLQSNGKPAAQPLPHH